MGSVDGCGSALTVFYPWAERVGACSFRSTHLPLFTEVPRETVRKSSTRLRRSPTGRRKVPIWRISPRIPAKSALGALLVPLFGQVLADVPAGQGVVERAVPALHAEVSAVGEVSMAASTGVRPRERESATSNCFSVPGGGFVSGDLLFQSCQMPSSTR